MNTDKPRLSQSQQVASRKWVHKADKPLFYKGGIHGQKKKKKKKKEKKRCARKLPLEATIAQINQGKVLFVSV